MKYKIIVALLLLVPIIAYASASTSISNSRNTAIVGQRITTTVKISLPSSYDACSWQFSLNYDQSRLNFSPITGTRDNTLVIDSGATTSSYEYKFSFVAKSSGTANIAVSPSAMYCAKGDADEVLVTFPSRSSSVLIRTQAEYEATLSSNNYLKSLSVAGFRLEPEFDKEVENYIVKIAPDTTTITISGVLDDSKSSVSGLGDIEVVDGENEIEIVVTAQNGSKRTYTILATVTELDPIIITINDQEYNVIRKIDQITCPSLFEKELIEYNEEEIPICYNEKNDLTLLVVRNKDSEIKYFVYDDMIEYKEIVNKLFVFFSLDFPEDISISDNYKKVKLTLNGHTIDAYRNDNFQDFNLIYGINIETGNEGIYQYDSKENTIQRYNVEEIEEAKKNNYQLLAIVFALSTLILLGTTAIIAIKNKKTKSKKEKDLLL